MRGHLKTAALVTAALLLLLGTAPSLVEQAASAGASLPRVRAPGADLVAGGQRFQAFGFNYGVGDRYPILRYFDDPTDERLHRVTADMREARSLGANTLRVYLEIKAFMGKPGEPKPRALYGLAALLDRAENVPIYLDLTGNLVWRAPPAWYDALSEKERWSVQARFWRAVARTAGDSNAVLAYELTSEPVISNSGRWYVGELELGGYTFIQNVVRYTAGRDPAQLARSWIRLMSDSIKRFDDRHLIGVGYLPYVGGPFSPANTADLLDVLILHEYPKEGQADESVEIVRGFADEGKPVVLGETYPLLAGADTWESFLLRSRRFLDGYLCFI